MEDALEFTTHKGLVFFGCRYGDEDNCRIMVVSKNGTNQSGSHIYTFDPSDFVETCQKLPMWGHTLATPGTVQTILLDKEDRAFHAPVSAVTKVLNIYDCSGSFECTMTLTRKVTSFGPMMCLKRVDFESFVEKDDGAIIEELDQKSQNSRSIVTLMGGDPMERTLLDERTDLIKVATEAKFLECPDELLGSADCEALESMGCTKYNCWRMKGTIDGLTPPAQKRARVEMPLSIEFPEPIRVVSRPSETNRKLQETLVMLRQAEKDKTNLRQELEEAKWKLSVARASVEGLDPTDPETFLRIPVEKRVTMLMRLFDI